MAAIFVPSGDQAGPQLPRESMESSGTGANHLSSFTAVDDIVRIWFVPSRNRLVIGAMPAIASPLPSGDQTGAPGCGSESCTLATLPLATSRTDICATRHMPSTLKNAMRVPSGDHPAPCGGVARSVARCAVPAFMSRIHSCRCSLSLSDEYASLDPSGDHAGSMSNASSLVTLTGAPPT